MLVAALLVAPHVGAIDCSSAPSEPELTQATPSGDVFYVDSEACAPGDCVASIWVYEESNDVAGLQRDDFRRDDTCGHGNGDALVALVFLVDAL